MVIKTSSICIIGDTHVKNYEDLPVQIQEAIDKNEWLVHVGDYISVDLLDVLKKKKLDKFLGVYGNADPMSIRERLPSILIASINGVKIGISHPASGGSETFTESKVINQFKEEEIDVIIYGHTHEAKIIRRDKILLLNPGKGYIEPNTFGPPTSYIQMKIGASIKAKIVFIN